MNTKLDRRKQPQPTIKAVGLVLKDIKWNIKEISSHKFFSPSGEDTNNSYGYILRIPRDMDDYIRKLWVGYLNHQDVQEPGIYAGMNPTLTGTKSDLTPLRAGYREAPFSTYILLKQIIPQKEIDRLENEYGRKKLKEKVKEILVKTYPFNVK